MRSGLSRSSAAGPKISLSAFVSGEVVAARSAATAASGVANLFAVFDAVLDVLAAWPARGMTSMNARRRLAAGSWTRASGRPAMSELFGVFMVLLNRFEIKDAFIVV